LAFTGVFCISIAVRVVGAGLNSSRGSASSTEANKSQRAFFIRNARTTRGLGSESNTGSSITDRSESTGRSLLRNRCSAASSNSNYSGTGRSSSTIGTSNTIKRRNTVSSNSSSNTGTAGANVGETVRVGRAWSSWWEIWIVAASGSTADVKASKNLESVLGWISALTIAITETVLGYGLTTSRSGVTEGSWIVAINNGNGSRCSSTT